MKQKMLNVVFLLFCYSFVGTSAAIAFEFHDSHFHLKNFIQKGPSAKSALQVMGNLTGRAALFGLPLQQKWDYALTGDRAPDYYLSSKARLYYYSAVDAMIAEEYLSLTLEEQSRFDPMITGFNPTDMYARDHIVQMLKLYPGVFSGIGEFSIHKEFVSGKIAGHAASLTNNALAEILNVASEIGLVVIIHCDIDEVRPLPDEPAYLSQLKAVFKSHPKTNIIWAHTGLGRLVAPRPEHLEILDKILVNPDFNHVNFDLSWDEVAKYVVTDEETVEKWAELITRHKSRFLFGTDSVAPKNQSSYAKTFFDYAPLWSKLNVVTRRMVLIENYERIFDEANRSVRAWEMSNFESFEDAVPIKHYYYESIRNEVEAQIQINAGN